MAFGVCTVVAVLWFIPMYEELRHRGKEAPAGAWVIVLGIFFWSFTLAWQRMFAMVLLYMGYPSWLQEGPLAAFVPFSIMWGGILFLAAIAMNRPTAVPSRMSMFYIMIAVAIGAFAAGYVGARALPF